MKLIIILLSISFLTIFVSCEKCNNEEPTAKVINNGTASVSLQITSSVGNVISISELGKGLISSEESYSPGVATISGSIDGIQLSESVNMSECTSYDITITSENKISIFSQDKN
ncbi:hypothetical protein [Brumimicrobium oceani]|uniref:Uncharacterized protein n=1 Tax=Brumimicrobium oceani TaxID=2100725 RepID=A0A2U2XDB0_9FLAO|nr:hypothetical protein [Brumimicrobium oceani]PWH85786.1 hypothetical protein DIT68_06745 [Brumimicrobium oceani]